VRKLKDSDYFLALHRSKKFLKQQERNDQKASHKLQQPTHISRPINLLNNLGLAEQFAHHGHNFDITIPEIFSIIHNPKETLRVLCGFAETIRKNNTKIKNITVDHGKMIKLDLSAESILDFLILEMKREEANKRKKIRFGGHYPKDAKLRRYLRAVGIIKNLKIEHEYLSEKEESTLRIFRMINKSRLQKVNVGTADIKERKVKEFVDHINSCLEDHGQQLTVSTRASLAHYTGEILGNAEEHSGLQDWTIAGYLDNEHESHLSEIAIFNFGKTIAETFKELPKYSYAYKMVHPYVEAHRRRSLFGTSWTEDDLLTLVALQGNISSKNESPEQDRGQGTVDLIHFFQNVHHECTKDTDTSCEAKMAILSGNTHIMFDGTYQMKSDPSGRQVIAFNKNNDLNEPPDNKYVTHLGKASFPGVIIGIRFPMVTSQTRGLNNGD